MFRDADDFELAGTIVLLTAEAAVVEARIKLLSDELAVINSRIVSVYESLHLLHLLHLPHRPTMPADGTAAEEPFRKSPVGPDRTMCR
ncbi:hypothetical protein KBZ94_32760 [Streptomyces sp. RM72]|uniref:hypothetical protein n=1 Tax=Streptomyces sp. RM72 TaxID=1115510 RepID=UPI001B358620|nr:hypothetical protein [Streptomyces sp. RM72]MBQ0889640.1 hypothetical protein [Streptomyces sp. RM72]